MLVCQGVHITCIRTPGVEIIGKKAVCVCPLPGQEESVTHSTLGLLACIYLTLFSLCVSSLILPGDGRQLIETKFQYLVSMFIRENALIFARKRKFTLT